MVVGEIVAVEQGRGVRRRARWQRGHGACDAKSRFASGTARIILQSFLSLPLQMLQAFARQLARRKTYG